MGYTLDISHPNVNGGLPYQLPWVANPLTLPEIVSETINTTASNDIFVDHFNVKQSIANTFDWLEYSQYEALQAFALAQRQYGTFCTASLLDGDGVPVRGWDELSCYLALTTLNIVDDCGTVNDVTLTLRETEQEDDGYSS